MEVASAIQHGRRTLTHKTARALLCSSNDTNSHLGEGSSKEVQIRPELSELHQERGVPDIPTVDNMQANLILPNRGTTSAISVDDDQGMQQDPLLETPLSTPLSTPVIESTTNEGSTMQEPQPQVPPDVSEFTSTQTPGPQRWSWVNIRDKQRRERGKNRMKLTKLCSVCSN